MTWTRGKAYGAAVIVIALSMAGIWLKPANQPGVSVRAAETASTDPCSNPPFDLVGSSPQVILRWLTDSSASSSSTTKAPRWVNWSTKADLGIDPDVPLSNLAKAQKSLSDLNEQPASDVRALFTLSSPLQGLKPKEENLNLTAPVLFNPCAAAAIQSASHDGARLAASPSFQRGAMIVKTIWEWMDGSSPQVFLTDESQSTEVNPKLNSQGAPPEIILEKGISLDPKFDTGCANINILKASRVPLNCVYSKTVTFKQIRAWQLLTTKKANEAFIDCKSSKRCRAILVGFHVMIKASDSWRFLTFWLQSQGQQNGLNTGPWQFFASNETDQQPADDRRPHTILSNQTSPKDKYDICFNPYLEGQKLNGSASNCVGCHQYARYSPQDKSVTDRTKLFTAAQGFGEPPFPGSATPRTQTPSCPAYLTYPLLTSTQFVWSIVTYFDSPAGGAVDDGATKPSDQSVDMFNQMCASTPAAKE